MELVEILFGERFKAVEDGLLGNRLKQMITPQTAVKRLNLLFQFKALHDFCQLVEWIERTQAIAKLDRVAHEQAAVAGEQNALIVFDQLCHRSILKIIFVQAIEAQHPQMGCQTTEMAIEHKTRLNRTAIFYGINLYLSLIWCNEIPRFSSTVDLYLSDLRVRHSKRLSQVLDGLPPFEVDRNSLSLLIALQKIVQPAMKGKVRRAHGMIIFLSRYIARRAVSGRECNRSTREVDSLLARRLLHRVMPSSQ